MGFNKTIQMCIFDGNPNGRIMCELSNWNGRVYKIARNDLNDFSNRPDSEYTGVYFLFGRDSDNNQIVYIGEAEKMISRLKQHLSKDFWNDCVAVISKDNVLNKAHVKFLENKFYCLALDAKRATIFNSTVPTCSSISEFDEYMLDEFIENTKLLVNALGYKVFEKVDIAKLNNSKIDENIFYISAARGANARGALSSDGFIVFKGSNIAIDTTQSMSSSLVNLRQKLIDKGIVNENFAFTTDYLFTSPSLAAAVVMGRNANGRVEWKTQTGKTVKDIEEI